MVKPSEGLESIRAEADSIVTNETDMNMKPSVIVQQQRQIQMGIFSTNANICANKPPRGMNPSNQATANSTRKHNFGSSNSANEASGGVGPQAQQNQMFDQDGLVLPKRILPHPVSGLSACVEQPIIRDLNRELKFNQIRGKNVLDQKSELKKALEKLEDNKRKKEAQQERLNRRSSLELRLEERAERLARETASGGSGDGTQSASGDNLNSATCNQPLSNFSLKSISNR